MPQSRKIQGLSVAPGLAIGRVHVIRAHAEEAPVWTVPEEDIPGELGRLAEAVTMATAHLRRNQDIVSRETGPADGQIFAVHLAILQDPSALREVENTIQDQRVNAEAAVEMLVKRYEEKMGRLEGDRERSFAADVRDPWRRVLDVLLARERHDFAAGEDPVILAATELTPQVVMALPRDRALGIITETGGRFSHGAVLARSMGLPTVTNLPNLLGRLEQGILVTIDGARGLVQLRPAQEDIDSFLERRQHFEARRKYLSVEAGLRAETPDGEELDVRVNINSVRDLATFDIAHTDGVGLLRTEFLYLERNEFPSEEEQYRMYRRVLEAFAPRPVTLRVLDIGGDKQLPYFKVPEENNPALGWRGLRVTLQWQDLLRVQLRAILRASLHGNGRILLPMVTSLEEILSVHRIYDGVLQSLLDTGFEIETEMPVGMMVEVPSSLLILPQLLEHVDFVSVGTNDLVQYVLAVDRDNPWVASIYDPQHPAVLRALQMVADAAREAGKPCGVCGDAAGDPAFAILLLGLGFDSISSAPNYLWEIKYAIRRTTLREARRYARMALDQKTSDGVRSVLVEIRKQLYDQEARDGAPVDG